MKDKFRKRGSSSEASIDDENRRLKKQNKKQSKNKRKRSSSSLENPKSNKIDRTKKIAKEVQFKNLEVKRYRINSKALVNIISDHKNMNRKLDQEEINRAAQKFKTNFTEEIKPVTMSAFLSNEALKVKSNIQKIDSYQCKICSIIFKEKPLLLLHSKVHSNQQAILQSGQ